MSVAVLEIIELLSRALFFLGYFSGFKALKSPLDAREEQALLERHLNGEKKARELLVEHNLRLVVHMAKKYQNTPIDMEDLISIGIIGLIKALDSYDPHKKTKFSTFAAKCIDNEILMALRMHTRSAANIYLDDVVSYGEDGSKLSLLEMLGCEEESDDGFARTEETLTLASILAMIDSVLTETEAKVIRLRYGVNTPPLTQAQIGRQLGISRSYVSRIEKRAIEKLSKRALH